MYDYDWSNFCLFANATIWTITFLLYQYKRRYFGVGSGILLLYNCISIGAFHLYNSEEYSYLFDKLTLFPFIYLFSMICLVSSPITTLKEKNIRKIEAPNELLFNIVCIGIIFFVFISLPNTLSTIRENFLLIIFDESSGAELYREGFEKLASQTKSEMNILGILSNISANVSLVFLGYYLTRKSRNGFILIGLLIASLSIPLYYLSSGARAPAAKFILNTMFTLLFIRNMLPLQLKRKIIRNFSILVFLLLIPFVAISLSRKGGDIEKVFIWFELYIAQGPLQFNSYGLDAGGIRYGDYTAVAFKYIAGLSPAMYYSGRLSRYSHMKLDESDFYTFVGDFTLDYGPVWAVLIFIATALFFKKCLQIQGDSITFHQFLMFYLLMTGCLGYFQFPLGRESGNLNMMALLSLAFVFKLSHDYLKHK